MEPGQISTEFIVLRQLTDLTRELRLIVDSFEAFVVLGKIGHLPEMHCGGRKIILKNGVNGEEAAEGGAGTMFFVECAL